MNKKTILKFNSTKSVRPFAWLALAILAVGAFGNSVQAQAWVDEKFNSLAAASPLTTGGNLVFVGPTGFATGAPGGGALRILKTTGSATSVRWALSDNPLYSTPRPSGYITFKIQQTPGVVSVATSYMTFRVGANDENNLNGQLNGWFEARFYNMPFVASPGTSTANLMVYPGQNGAGAAGSKTGNYSINNGSSPVKIEIWYNNTAAPINYIRPDTRATVALAAKTFVLYAADVLITPSANGTSFGTTTVNTIDAKTTAPIAPAVTADTVGKIGFVVGSSQTGDFIIDDIYAADSAPASTSAPTLTTDPTSVTAQAGTTVNNTISYGGNPTPTFLATETWPIWATLSSSGTATFSPSSSETTGPYTLYFEARNSRGSIIGTFNVNVTAAATIPPTITSSSSPVVAKYLSTYTVASPLYTLTANGDAPITYTADNLPAGLSLSEGKIIGSATTLGQSVNVTLTAINGAGSSTPITLPIKVANYSWNGTGTDWTQASSWDYDGAVATLAPVFNFAGDVAVLGSGGSAVEVPVSGSSIAGLLFNADSPAYEFSGGTLTVGNNARIVNQSTSAITFNNKVANNGGNATWTSVTGGSIVLNGGFDCTGNDSTSSRTVTLGGTGNFQVNGVIGNGGTSPAAGAVAVTSTGTTLFKAANTYSGATTVGADANLELGNAAALGDTTGATTVSGTLDLLGFSPALERFTLSGGSIVNSSATPVTIDGTVALTGVLNTINTSTAAMTMSGVISGTGGFTKTGANTLTLTGVNTFTGGLTLNGGTVIGNSESPFGNHNSSFSINLLGGNLIVQNAAALGYGANGSVNVTARPKVNLGGGTLTAQADLTLNANSGTSGQVTISAPSTISVGNNRTVRIERMVATDIVTAANSVLTKTGPGTLTIIGNASTVIGGYMVNEGTLAFNGSSNAGMGSGPIVMNGGSLWVSKGAGSKFQYSGFNIANLLSLQQNTVNYFEPNVNSPAGYNVMSLGALNLNGYKLTYMRTSTTPFVSVPQTVPMVTLRSAILNPGANGLENDNSVVIVLQGASGTGGLTKTGTGTLVLSDQPNQISPNAVVTGGVVTSIGLPDNPMKGFTETPNVTIAAPMNLDGTPVLGGVRATATATVANGVITAITVDSGDGGSGYLSAPQVTVTPNDAVTFNTYNGTTSVQGGKLNLSGSSSSSISFASGTTLELNYQAPSEASASLDSDVSTMPLKGISLAKSFAGYTVPPTVTIGAPQNLDGSQIANGVAATATAQIANGRIVGFTITSLGSGYSLAQRPNVTITPPDQETVVATTTGSLNFALGSRVRVTMSSAPVAGRSYTLVTASGGITGTPVLESLTVNGVATTGYTLSKSGNNLILEQVSLDGYGTYLLDNGFDSATPFNAVTANGAQVGLVYAFGSASGMPQNNGVTAVPVMNGNQLTYAFDVKDDSALTVTYQTSTDLVTWTTAHAVSVGTGSSPTGFLKKQVQVTGSGKLFVKINVTHP